MTVPVPAWGADVPISLPVPPDPGEPIMVEMYGFGVTQYRLVHVLTAADYERLSVPVYAPSRPDLPVINDDAWIDGARPPAGSP